VSTTSSNLENEDRYKDLHSALLRVSREVGDDYEKRGEILLALLSKQVNPNPELHSYRHVIHEWISIFEAKNGIKVFSKSAELQTPLDDAVPEGISCNTNIN
jgi:hypothetical protein